VVFLTYVGFIYKRYGVLHSISMSYYELKKDKLGMLFYIFCIALAAPLFAIYLDTGNILWVVASFGFALTGTASKFSEKHTDIAHYTGAGLGILFCFLGLGFAYDVWAVRMMIPATLVLVVTVKKNAIWWIEIAAFVFIIMGMIKAAMI
jgi:hypothetical protein